MSQREWTSEDYIMMFRRRWPIMLVLAVVGGLAAYVLSVGYAIPAWATRVKAFPSESEAVVVPVVGGRSGLAAPGRKLPTNRHRFPGPASNPLGLDRTDPEREETMRTTINQLNLPVDRPVLVHLSTKDVIHSFGIGRDAREAGRHSRHADSRMVRADARRRLRDCLLSALRSRSLPDARLRHRPDGRRLQNVDGGSGKRAARHAVGIPNPHQHHRRARRRRAAAAHRRRVSVAARPHDARQARVAEAACRSSAPGADARAARARRHVRRDPDRAGVAGLARRRAVHAQRRLQHDVRPRRHRRHDDRARARAADAGGRRPDGRVRHPCRHDIRQRDVRLRTRQTQRDES